MTKKMFFMASGFLLVCSILSGILGQNWVPWWKTIRQSAADQLMSLVDQSELKLQQASDKINKFQAEISKNAGNQVRVEAMIGKVTRKQEQVDGEIAQCRKQLRGMKEKLLAGEVYVSTAGQPFSSAQLQNRIQHQAKMIEIKKSKAKSLERLYKIGKQRLAKLKQFAEEAPNKMEQLVAQCRLLEAKIAAADELKKWRSEMNSMDYAEDSEFTEIMDSLEALGVEVDAEVAGIDALMAMEEGPGFDESGPSTETLLADIDRALR